MTTITLPLPSEIVTTASIKPFTASSAPKVMFPSSSFQVAITALLSELISNLSSGLPPNLTVVSSPAFKAISVTSVPFSSSNQIPTISVIGIFTYLIAEP